METGRVRWEWRGGGGRGGGRELNSTASLALLHSQEDHLNAETRRDWTQGEGHPDTDLVRLVPLCVFSLIPF